jgi:hypothetical protein
MSDYFRFPFGLNGDLEAIPNTTQMDGAVSLQEGFGSEYSLDLRTDPEARAIEREKFNYIINRITSAIRWLQMNGGIPEFITTADNGGSAYSYPLGALVRYTDGGVTRTYRSKVNTNTSLPTVTGDWSEVDAASGIVLGIITNTMVASNAAIDATKIANGQVSNAEYQYLDGVTSAIQTQLNGKQASGNYITALTGDIAAAGPGSVSATLSTTGVVAGTYYNANVQVDAKGRILSAESGPSPIGLLEGFESWSSGLPDTLPWGTASPASISQSALHVTQGALSCAFSSAVGISMSATVNLSQFRELLVDVYVGTMAGGGVATITCGANSSSTPVATPGVYTLSVQVPIGATSIVLSTTAASTVWWDNLRYRVLMNIDGADIINASIAGGKLMNSAVGTTQIADDAVTYAKMQDMAANTVLGNATGSTATPTAISATAAGRALLAGASASAQRTSLGLGDYATMTPNPFSAFLGSNQTGITFATWTKINFANEAYDVGGFFNTANGRFQPTVAGYYELVGIVEFNTANIADGSAARAAIYYNGGTNIDLGPYNNASTASVNIGAIAHGQRFFNGSTDYAEFFVLAGGTGNKTANSGNTYFFGKRIG